MSKITNNHSTALALPSGQVLKPGEATPVEGWGTVKDNAVIKAWIAAGILSVDGDAKAAGGGEGGGAPAEKDELFTKLDALGVAYDKRSGVAKLRAQLEEAEKAAAAKAAGGGEG